MAAHRSSGKRYSVEAEQEDLSLDQIRVAFAAWPVDRFARDLGEDIVVRICENGNPTGLAFFAQCKSVADTTKHRTKGRPEELHYSIDVSHLQQWLSTTTPVLLIIWCVSTNQGWWNDVVDIVNRVEAVNPNWRNQQTVTAVVPMANTTTGEGRAMLRHRIASLATAGKEAKLQLAYSFPNTPEGRSALRGFKRALEHGDRHEIEGKYIQKFAFSGPARWAITSDGLDQIPESVTIQAGPSSASLFCTLEAIGTDRTESIAIELKRTKGGSHSTTFSNEGLNQPLSIALVVCHPPRGEMTKTLHLKYSFPAASIQGTLALARFLLVVKQGGGVQLRGPSGTVWVPYRPWDGTDSLTVDGLHWWAQALVKLNYIQSRVFSYGTFDISKLANVDPDLIDSIHRALSTGQDTGRLSFKLCMGRSPNDATQERKGLRLEGASWELLGVKIPCGREEIEIVDEQFWSGLQSATEADAARDAEFTDLPAKFTYLDWGPAAEEHAPQSPAK